ncbi:hypothetical protein LIER_28597 [Lithospermum erythrorhizon]|uniref:Uncharacterized protein n=1 Tax=Lithospermum erythrorhizon TaxID=34254 RepID=A0AAV3RHC9_LITER
MCLNNMMYLAVSFFLPLFVIGLKEIITHYLSRLSFFKNSLSRTLEPAEGWPVPLQVIPPISEKEEEGMPMFDLDNAPHQNLSPDDDVQPDFRPGSNMHGRNCDDSTGNFQNPNPTFDILAGSSRSKSSVEKGEGLIDEGVTPIVEENTSDRGSKSLGCIDGIEIEDEAIANILDGLRKAKKGQLDADKLSVEADKGLRKRRLRKGIPNRFTGKGNIGEKSKGTESQAGGSISDNEDVVFVGEKAGIGRKRTRASVAAAKEAVKEGTEDTKIDLEELERSAEKKKATKKGKGKVQGEIEKQKKKMDESGYTRKTRSKIIPRNNSSSEAEDDPGTLRISKRESKGKLKENDDMTRIEPVQAPTSEAASLLINILEAEQRRLKDEIQAKQVRVAEIDVQLQSLKAPVPPVVTTEKTTAGPSTTPVSNAGSSDDEFVDVEEGNDEDLGAEGSQG